MSFHRVCASCAVMFGRCRISVSAVAIGLRCSRWTIPGKALMNVPSTFHCRWAAAECYHEQWTFSALPALPDLSIDPPFLIFLMSRTVGIHTWQSPGNYSTQCQISTFGSSWFQLVPIGSHTTQASRTATKALFYSQAIMIGWTPGFCMLWWSIHKYSQSGAFPKYPKWAAIIGASLAQKPKAVQQFCSLGNRMKRTITKPKTGNLTEP